LRRPAELFLALAVAGAVCASGGAAHLSTPDASLGMENVDVYWMSGVIENDRACVGMLGLHGSNAYDLVADGSGPCSGPWATQVNLRALAYSSVPHVTLSAYIWSEQNPSPTLCDYIEAQTVQQPSGESRGTYRYVHAIGNSGYSVYIAAGRNLSRTDVLVGSTTEDSNCIGGWEGYHTHQYAVSGYSTPNLSLPVNDDIPVWNSSYYIHKWTYPLPDTDGDDFDDVTEFYLGTDAYDNCPDNSSDDAWPLDINKDRYVTMADVNKFSGRIGATGGPPPSPNWLKRLDLNTDNFITMGDINLYADKLGTHCT
jgi:hypothetical protein